MGVSKRDLCALQINCKSTMRYDHMYAESRHKKGSKLLVLAQVFTSLELTALAFTVLVFTHISLSATKNSQPRFRAQILIPCRIYMECGHGSSLRHGKKRGDTNGKDHEDRYRRCLIGTCSSEAKVHVVVYVLLWCDYFR